MLRGGVRSGDADHQGALGGFLSAANLNKLEDAGFSFIVGSRTSSAPYDLAEHYATVGNIVIDGETIETVRMMGTGVNARVRGIGSEA